VNRRHTARLLIHRVDSKAAKCIWLYLEALDISAHFRICLSAGGSGVFASTENTHISQHMRNRSSVCVYASVGKCSMCVGMCASVSLGFSMCVYVCVRDRKIERVSKCEYIISYLMLVHVHASVSYTSYLYVYEQCCA
jgi:hypothetical protein